MARSGNDRKFRTAEGNLVVVLQAPVDLDRRETITAFEDAVVEFAAVFEDRGVGDSGVHLGAAHSLDGGEADGMVEVGLHREQDFGVFQLETEFAGAFDHLRDGAFEAGVDDDMSLGRGDEVAAEVGGADVMKVACDRMRREGLLPVVALRERRGGQQKRGGE